MGFLKSSSHSKNNYKFAQFDEKRDYKNRCNTKHTQCHQQCSSSTKSRASSTSSASTNSNLTFQLPTRS